MAKPQQKLEVHKLYGGEVEVTLDGRHKYQVFDKGVKVEDVVNVTGVSGLVDKPGLKFWAANLACDHILTAHRNGDAITEELIEVARRRHVNYTQEAADIGTQVHDWVEAFVRAKIANKELPELPDEKLETKKFNGVLSFLRWQDQSDVEFVSTERILYSRRHRVVGKMDAEIRLNGKLIVADWKTSNPRKPKKADALCGLCSKVGCGGVYNEYRYQTALYEAMASEEHGFLHGSTSAMRITASGEVIDHTQDTQYQGDRLIARFDKESGEFSAHRIGDFEKDITAALALLVAKRRELELE